MVSIGQRPIRISAREAVRRAAGSRRCRRQVVERDAVDRAAGKVLRYPVLDLPAGVGATVWSAEAAATDKVIDLSLSDVLFELLKVGDRTVPLNPPTGITGSLVASW